MTDISSLGSSVYALLEFDIEALMCCMFISFLGNASGVLVASSLVHV